MSDPDLRQGLAPTGTLRAAINLGNPVLAQGTGDEPSGLAVDLALTASGFIAEPLRRSNHEDLTVAAPA